MNKMNIKHNLKTLIFPHMAPITFFIILTLTLSSTIHARDSQFFNKFSNKESLNTNQQQQQETLNTNQQQQQETLNTNQQQQQPEFIPQSKDSDSYGLYGHETGQLPPSATTTNNNNLPDNLPENYNPVAYTTPIHSSTQDIPEEYREYPQAYNKYNGESNRMYNSEMQDNGRYKSQKQGFGFDDARFMEREDGGGNMYNSEKQGETRYYGTRGNGNMMYNPEKQGMSDTRFLENGKYFYDINMENPSYNPNTNINMNTNTRGFGSRNGYNTQGYYGNNQNSYDRYNYNNNGGYQNQEYRFNP